MSEDSIIEPAASGDYALSKSFPYLVRRVGLLIGELFDRAAAPLGVDVSMYRVLAALAERDGQQLGQLAEVTVIELSTLSRLVGVMAQKGLLTRRRPRNNGRIVEITLSAKGRRLVEELIPLAEMLEGTAVKGLSAGDVAALKSSLSAAYRNLALLEAGMPSADAKPASVPRRGSVRRSARRPAPTRQA